MRSDDTRARARALLERIGLNGDFNVCIPVVQEFAEAIEQPLREQIAVLETQRDDALTELTETRRFLVAANAEVEALRDKIRSAEQERDEFRAANVQLLEQQKAGHASCEAALRESRARVERLESSNADWQVMHDQVVTDLLRSNQELFVRRARVEQLEQEQDALKDMVRELS